MYTLKYTIVMTSQIIINDNYTVYHSNDPLILTILGIITLLAITIATLNCTYFILNQIMFDGAKCQQRNAKHL